MIVIQMIHNINQYDAPAFDDATHRGFEDHAASSMRSPPPASPAQSRRFNQACSI